MQPQKKQRQPKIEEAEELKKLAEKILNRPKLDINELIKESHRRVQDYFEKRERITTRVIKPS